MSVTGPYGLDEESSWSDIKTKDADRCTTLGHQGATAAGWLKTFLNQFKT